MKESTKEQKAKAYNEAVEKLRNAFYGNNSRMCEEYRNAVLKIIEPIFPELKESDDERIRKWLIKDMGRRLSCWTSTEVTKEQVLAWLEKQGEKIEPIEGFNTEFERQISHLIASTINKEYEYTEAFVKWTSNALLNYAKIELEKQGEKKPILAFNAVDWQLSKVDGKIHNIYNSVVEPKFKVGDWIIHKDNKHIPIKIIEKIGMYYRTVDTVNYYRNIYISYINENYRLWTIQDAKDGDVLSFNDGHGNDCIELIKSITGKKIEFWFCLTNGNDYEVFDGVIPYTNLVSREGATPATREQRDLLFQKMKEAGYDWDSRTNKMIYKND